MENPELRFFLRPSIDIMLEWDLFTMDNFYDRKKASGRTVFPPTSGRFGFALNVYTSPRPWQFLNFLPLPHGHGSLRPGNLSLTIGVFC